MGTHFGLTVWTGSAFDCARGEVVLLHQRFPENSRSECNAYDGSITAQSLRVENNSCFVSQLNVNVSHDMIGKTIKCILDDLYNETLIGSLEIITGERRL